MTDKHRLAAWALCLCLLVLAVADARQIVAVPPCECLVVGLEAACPPRGHHNSIHREQRTRVVESSVPQRFLSIRACVYDMSQYAMARNSALAGPAKKLPGICVSAVYASFARCCCRW